MKTTETVPVTQKIPASLARQAKLARLMELMDRCSSPKLFKKEVSRFTGGTGYYELPKYSCAAATEDPLKVGIFAGIHGNESASAHAVARFSQLLERNSGFARGYSLSLFPVCNPSGYEFGTSANRAGKDLNREFWAGSREPEVFILQNEIRDAKFNGIISLGVSQESRGMFAYASGSTLARHLLKPALAAASQYLPINTGSTIEGVPAREGIVERLHSGALSAPPGARPRPFEISIQVPAQAPRYLQENGLITALVVILTEYRNLISYAPNL